METLEIKERVNPGILNFGATLTALISDLIYPQICFACESKNRMYDHIMCLHCNHEIAATDHWCKSENDFTKKFIGRVSIEQGGSLYKFIEGGRFQKLVHKLKYENKPAIGTYLGQHAAQKINENWVKPDIIVPVPMHELKKWKRGYNQAEIIGAAIADSLDIPQINLLSKSAATTSQTKYHRYERLKNMESAFSLSAKSNLNGRHILLVDDVLTTGATLEACALVLQQIPDIKISMFTLGIGLAF